MSINYCDINTLLGLTIIDVDVNSDEDKIVFHTKEGRTFWMYHVQDCCESVTIEDVVGDWEDLIGQVCTLAYESTNRDDPSGREYEESYTWTYYNIGSPKGNVHLRWFGQSNGYYSEAVDFGEVVD